MLMNHRVIVNYADYGLQFFTSDGVFYVEIGLGVCCLGSLLFQQLDLVTYSLGSVWRHYKRQMAPLRAPRIQSRRCLPSARPTHKPHA